MHMNANQYKKTFANDYLMINYLMESNNLQDT